MTSRSTWTKVALIGGLLCGAGEVLLAPTMDGLGGAAFALLFGALFFAGCRFLWRGRSRGAALIGVLAAIELAFMPAYDWSGAAHFTQNALFVAVSVVALVGSLGVLVERRRLRATSLEAAA